MLWIDDGNYSDLVNHPANGTLPRGEHPQYAGYASHPSALRYEDAMPPIIGREEWDERIRDMDAAQAWASDRITWEPRSQKSTNYCWGNGPCTAAETQAVTQGLPFVQWSAASVCAPITGFRNVGGWGLDALEYLEEFGAAADILWPNAAISRTHAGEAVEADRLNRRVLEWVDVPTTFDALATCLLLGFACAVGYNWWRHEVVATRLVKSAKGYGVEIRNSWGDWGDKNRHGVSGFSIVGESKGRPDDCQVIRAVTASPVIPVRSGVYA